MTAFNTAMVLWTVAGVSALVAAKARTDPMVRAVAAWLVVIAMVGLVVLLGGGA